MSDVIVSVVCKFLPIWDIGEHFSTEFREMWLCGGVSSIRVI